MSDGARAIEIYKNIFGAEERYRLIDPANGRTVTPNSPSMARFSCFRMNTRNLTKLPRCSAGLRKVFQQDVDASFQRALDAGAESLVPLADQCDGRLRDPCGHEWLLSQVIEKVTPEEMQRRWDAW